MKRITIVPLACLALAACNQPSVSLTNASPEEVAKAAATTDILKLKPGRWEAKVELAGVSAADLPPGVPKAVLDKIQQASIVTYCISPEQAAMGPRQFLETPAVKQMHCSFAKAEIGNGTISTEMSCNIAGMATTTRSNGTYSATEYAVDGEQTRAGSDKVQRSRTTGKWIGACDGTEGKAK